MSKVEQQLMLLVGMLAILFGFYVMAGWLLANPAMVKIIPDSTAIPFNSALCFMLTGTWLVLRPSLPGDQEGRRPHLFMTIVALIVIFLPVLVLVEILSHINLGIDMLALHHTILDSNPDPGHMSPNACAAFIVIGIALLADVRCGVKLRRRIFTVCGLLVIAIGGLSFLGYMLQLDWLYHFARFNSISLCTSTGVTLIGMVLFLVGQSTTYDIPENNKGEDSRLTRIAAAIMIVLALASGLTGFVVLKRGTDQSLQDNLQLKAGSAADYVKATLDQQFLLTDKLLSFPETSKDLEILSTHPEDAPSLEHLNKVGALLFSLGYNALQIENADGKVVFSLGAPLAHSEMSMPLKISGNDANLLWDQGLILHIEKPIFANSVRVGTAVTEQTLATLDKLVHQIQYSGQTTDVGLCHRAGDDFECFPTRIITRFLRIPMFKDGQATFPMTHALLGETGILYANDIRGHPILAAFTPVGDTGLGLVVKIETVEIYGFIRERLDLLLLLLVCFVTVGVYVLRARLLPLASRLVRSELRMRAAKESLEQDAQWLNEIIGIQNEIARSPLDFTAVLQTIVDQIQRLTHSAGAIVELIDGPELYYRATSGIFFPYTGFRLKVEGSLSGHCIASGKIIRCDDTETDPRTDKAATRQLGIRSMIVAPLINEAKIIGVLKTASGEPNRFDAKDEQALQLLSSLISTALGHQQDYEEKQKLLSERTEALKNLEEASDTLRASEERTRVIIQSAYEAFISLDREGNVTGWNRQAESIFGWTSAEVIGQNLAELIIPATSQILYAGILSHALAVDNIQNQGERMELTVKRRTGELLIVEMTLNPIRTRGAIMLAAFLHDITERKMLQEKMTQLAQYDALTGLPNRALFLDRLSISIMRAARNDKPMALMFLDLDGFKKINDNFGHQAGDALLKQVADRLNKTVRKSDTVSRLAGDEFTIILEELADPEQNLQTVAQKIIATIAAPYMISGETLNVTTSIGIAVTKSGTKNLDEMIKLADSEMYKAKHSGRNRFSLCWM